MFGSEYPLMIGGREVTTKEKMKSTIHRSRRSDWHFPEGHRRDGEPGRGSRGARAFERWKRVPAEERVACIYRAAEFCASADSNWMAWLSFEIGKTWPEADADIAELIDFCEYYGARNAAPGGAADVDPMRGEKNYLRYIPLGVGVVIPPWNFAAGDHGGHDGGGDRHREHSRREAVERYADDCRDIRRTFSTKPACRATSSAFSPGRARRWAMRW